MAAANSPTVETRMLRGSMSAPNSRAGRRRAPGATSCRQPTMLPRSTPSVGVLVLVDLARQVEAHRHEPAVVGRPLGARPAAHPGPVEAQALALRPQREARGRGRRACPPARLTSVEVGGHEEVGPAAALGDRDPPHARARERSKSAARGLAERRPRRPPGTRRPLKAVHSSGRPVTLTRARAVHAQPELVLVLVGDAAAERGREREGSERRAGQSSAAPRLLITAYRMRARCAAANRTHLPHRRQRAVPPRVLRDPRPGHQPRPAHQRHLRLHHHAAQALPGRAAGVRRASPSTCRAPPSATRSTRSTRPPPEDGRRPGRAAALRAPRVRGLRPARSSTRPASRPTT